MYKKILPFITLFSLLAGCGGGGQVNHQTPESSEPIVVESADGLFAAMAKSGKTPNLDHSNSRAGIDADQNGVRDDIDEYLHRLNLTQEQTNAAIQVASWYQKIQTTEPLTENKAAEISRNLLNSLSCFHSKMQGNDGYYTYHNKIESFTANTYERTKRYNEYNSLRSGSVTRLPQGDGC